MVATEQTLQQIDRFIKKILQKFPETEDNVLMTDIHLRVSQDSGEMVAFDDDENEITRCVVEQWIENTDEDFYEETAKLLRSNLQRQHAEIEQMGILKPFSFVLEDDERESLEELHLIDDETIIIGGNLMEDLEKDLDCFLEGLLK
ncbi:MAG: hypothetical protein ILA04_05465 [Prevotella sp.]|nr:hypothetical protein [Prevotella sp.]